jgi:hypothetical protein
MMASEICSKTHVLPTSGLPVIEESLTSLAVDDGGIIGRR